MKQGRWRETGVGAEWSSASVVTAAVVMVWRDGSSSGVSESFDLIAKRDSSVLENRAWRLRYGRQQLPLSETNTTSKGKGLVQGMIRDS